VSIVRSDPVAEPFGTVVLVHGFTRSPRALAELSDRCLLLGARTLRPALGSLWWPTSTNNASHLSHVADEVERMVAAGPVVVVGHSAGASSGAWIAAALLDHGVSVTSVVMVDGVESPTGLIRRSWPRMVSVRVHAVCAPPSRCNRDGALAAWLADRPGECELVIVPGSGHGDIEGPSRALYRWACGDDAEQPAASRLRAIVDAWIGEGLARSNEAASTPDR
jgi:pimeloyl-ACP methyl ester carboxylesterase